MEALKTNGYTPADIDLLVPHQANLRISQFVQRVLKLKDDQVWNRGCGGITIFLNVIPDRISQFVQRVLKLKDDQVWNNIQKYGNTTAASIPIALCEAWEAGKVKEGDLVCLAAFGSGFTWGSALIRW